MYRGLGVTLVGVVPYAGMNFYVYGGLKEMYRARHGPESQPGVLASLGMGAASGLAAQVTGGGGLRC